MEAAAITKHCSAYNPSVVRPAGPADAQQATMRDPHADLSRLLPLRRCDVQAGGRNHRGHDLRLLVVQAEERADDEGARERAHRAER
jgi:hypothetical protein